MSRLSYFLNNFIKEGSTVKMEVVIKNPVSTVLKCLKLLLISISLCRTTNTRRGTRRGTTTAGVMCRTAGKMGLAERGIGGRKLEVVVDAKEDHDQRQGEATGGKLGSSVHPGHDQGGKDHPDREGCLEEDGKDGGGQVDSREDEKSERIIGKHIGSNRGVHCKEN